MIFRRVGRERSPLGTEAVTVSLPTGHARPDGISAGAAVAVCHPDWRGVRSATFALGLPVIECRDLSRSRSAILEEVAALGAGLVVVSGFPPGVDAFSREAVTRGVRVRVLMHSSMAQHGAELPEALMIAEIANLLREGSVDALGFTKVGQAEALTALGVPSRYVPARIGVVEPVARVDLGPGEHVGVFAEASWRKNVVTQLGAVALLDATAHVTHLPAVPYLKGYSPIREHGLVTREAFLSLVRSMDLNLAVSLYECFPVLPQESYWLGVPCLLSRTSALFSDDPVLDEFVFVDEHDNPSGIARASRRLLETAEREGIVDRARAWMHAWNERTEADREAFYRPT